MSLSIDARHCGTVYVIRCSGRIVAGEESGILEESIKRGLREFRHIVVDVGGVSRVDSSGLGLLVRNLAHVRSRAGDLRLASAPPFLADLLRATKLDTVFKLCGSEEEAILSFLKEPAIRGLESSPTGPMVLFVDRSPDLCAFVRALLNSHGYGVLSTCRSNDAKLLLLSTDFDYLVLGPECSQGPSDAAADKLKVLAHSAVVAQLSMDFKYDDPERAGSELLRLLETARAAGM